MFNNLQNIYYHKIPQIKNNFNQLISHRINLALNIMLFGQNNNNYTNSLMKKQIPLDKNKKLKFKSKSKQFLQQLSNHIKTQKIVTKEQIIEDQLLNGCVSINRIQQQHPPNPQEPIAFNYFNNHKLNISIIKINKFTQKLSCRITQLIANNSGKTLFSVRDQISFTGLKKKKDQKQSQFAKLIKMQSKSLLKIKQISKEDKIKNLRIIRQQFREVVNTSNNVSVKNEDSFFRAYVQKGNNGVLIKQLLKKRWWWHLEEKNSSKANFVWTQWFNKCFTTNLPQMSDQIAQTFHQDYSIVTVCDQPKLNSIKMLVDQTTFKKIKPRISLKNMHYFKGNLSLNVRQNSCLNKIVEQQLKLIQAPNSSIHNHIDGCLQLHSKKLLFKNLTEYLKKKDWDPFNFIPLTFYIDKADSPQIKQLLSKFDEIEANKQTNNSNNVWLIKPGQNSNRGFGITIHCYRNQLEQQIKTRLQNNQGKKSIIVQKYIEDCMLINKRKFDMRCYILLTTVNGILKGYWYNEGYIRTSSEQFNLTDVSNLMIHLTNDAVQKNNKSYGKFQDYNKMSFIAFKRYLSKHKYPYNSFQKAYEQMKMIAYYLIASVSKKIRRKQYTFQLFGLDFMLDTQLKPLLIEANSNPCLQTSGVILGKLIPELVDNVLMTAVDPLFPAPKNGRNNKEYLSKDYFRSNKFELIFSEETHQTQ